MSNELTTPNGATSTPAIIEKPRAPVSSGPRGLELNSLEEMWRFAQYASKSGLCPKGVETAEAVFIAIQMGAELGLTPMASLQGVAVINGRPSVWGDAMLAVCRSQGIFDEAAFVETLTGTGDAMTATCTVRRKPHGNPVTHEFTVARAKKAGLWGKSGPWTQYPERMLQMRARAFALRDTFTDVLRGFKCAEEMDETIDVESAPATNPAQDLTALAERLTATPEAAPVAEPASDPDADWQAAALEREAREATSGKRSRSKDLLTD